jgi:hypothetical protein
MYLQSFTPSCRGLLRVDMRGIETPKGVINYSLHFAAAQFSNNMSCSVGNVDIYLVCADLVTLITVIECRRNARQRPENPTISA